MRLHNLTASTPCWTAGGINAGRNFSVHVQHTWMQISTLTWEYNGWRQLVSIHHQSTTRFPQFPATLFSLIIIPLLKYVNSDSKFFFLAGKLHTFQATVNTWCMMIRLLLRCIIQIYISPTAEGSGHYCGHPTLPNLFCILPFFTATYFIFTSTHFVNKDWVFNITHFYSYKNEIYHPYHTLAERERPIPSKSTVGIVL